MILKIISETAPFNNSRLFLDAYKLIVNIFLYIINGNKR